MKKRVLSVFLTLALSLGLATPSLAANETTYYLYFNAISTAEKSEISISGAGLKLTERITCAEGGLEAGQGGPLNGDGDSFPAFTTSKPVTVTITADYTDWGNTTNYVRDEGDYVRSAMVFDASSGVDEFGHPNDGESVAYFDGRYAVRMEDGSVKENAGTLKDYYMSGSNEHIYIYQGATVTLSEPGDYLVSVGMGDSWGSYFNKAIIHIVEDNNQPTVPSFTDVANGAYYADAVKWAVNKKITVGTSATTFSPEQTCTVAQILTFLYRANGSPQVTIPNPFTDVRTSDYYYNAALWAYQNGLVSGSTFGPSAPCTRSMVVTCLWKLAGNPYTAPAAAPDASSLSYTPYTLSGAQDVSQLFSGAQDVRQFTLQFDAAVTEKTKITLHIDHDSVGGSEEGEEAGFEYFRDIADPKTYDITLIAVRPGSEYVIDGGFWFTNTDIFGEAAEPEWYDGIPAEEYYRHDDGTFRFVMQDMGYFGFVFTEDFLEAVRLHGNEGVFHFNHGSCDGGVLIQLDGVYYFVTYADSAIAAGLLKSGSGSFSDVPSHAPYAQAVAWAVDQGITSGTSKTTFSPAEVCTRGQIVTFLHRAFGK